MFDNLVRAGELGASGEYIFQIAQFNATSNSTANVTGEFQIGLDYWYGNSGFYEFLNVTNGTQLKPGDVPNDFTCEYLCHYGSGNYVKLCSWFLDQFTQQTKDTARACFNCSAPPQDAAAIAATIAATVTIFVVFAGFMYYAYYRKQQELKMARGQETDITYAPLNDEAQSTASQDGFCSRLFKKSSTRPTTVQAHDSTSVRPIAPLTPQRD